MKKFLKRSALLVVGFTVGEFVTCWRLQPNPIPFGEFVKTFFGYQKVAYHQTQEALSRLATNPDDGKAALRKIAFPQQ